MKLLAILHSAPAVHPVAAGILDTLTTTNADLLGLLKNVAVTVILGMFLWQAHKKGWATGAVFSGLLIAALLFFALNGGLQWLGTQFQTQWGA